MGCAWFFVMSNLCIHTDVTKRVLLILTLIISIFTVTIAPAVADESGQVEAPANHINTNSETNNSQESNNPAEKVDSQPKNPAEKALFGKKSDTKPLGTRTDTSTSDRLRQMIAMVVVIIILGGICWVVSKKFLPRLKGPAGIKGRAVRIIETTYIAPRQPVHLLQIGGKKLLIAGGKDGLKMLADVTDDFSSLLDTQTETAEAK